MKSTRHEGRWWHFGLLVLLLLALGGALSWAWSAAGGTFANLWLTPDQQGERLLARGRYAEAARRFRDPQWQGVALYRAGQFKEAAAAFARLDVPAAVFDRGNALVMLGKYAEAIASYDHALQGRPDWPEARANRALAEARRQQLTPPEDNAGGTGGQVEADAYTFDNRPKQSSDTQEVEVVAGENLSNEQMQALWLRRVHTRPADFLRAKFAYQYAQQQQEGKQP
jgi:Ca-activated chloride channel family protein